MKNKFDFYEIVRVKKDKINLDGLNDCDFQGVIVGMAKNEVSGVWGYAVSIYEDQGLVWDLDEGDLIYTGKKSHPEEVMSEESIKVRVNPETGEGELVED